MQQAAGRRLRALVLAPECSPASSHAAGSAWQIVSRLCRWHDLWVIVGSCWQGDIEDHVRRNPELDERMSFTFVPLKVLTRGADPRPVIPLRANLRLRRWQRRALDTARELHQRVGFDLVHHLRGASFREPGFCWKLPIPFVWGPTGGNTGVPWPLLGELGIRDRVLHCLRNVITAAQFRFSPRVRRAAKRASVLLAQTTLDQRAFARAFGVRPLVAHEQAADPQAGAARQYDGSRPLRIGWVGRFEGFKALPLVLRALARLGDAAPFELHIIGDGRCRQQWREAASKLGIASRCVWHGWLPHPDAQRKLAECDVLAFASLLEATSSSVMQALSLGLPVVCLRHCGYGDVVDDTCGVLINVGRPASVVEGFAEAIAGLIREPGAVRRLSQGALERAQAHSWDRLADVIRQAYETAAGGAPSGVAGNA